MLDFLLVSTIINLIWTVFGFIFFLYKFTSFLSYIYSFTKFCGKLIYGVNWLKKKCISYFFPSPGYEFNYDSSSDSSSSSDADYDYENKPSFFKRIFQRIKNKKEHQTIQIHRSIPITQYPSHINSNDSYFTNHINQLISDDQQQYDQSSVYLNFNKNHTTESIPLLYNDDIPFNFHN